MFVRPLAARFGLATALILLVILAVAGATAPAGIKQSDKLVILSTTDVKGKTSPCG